MYAATRSTAPNTSAKIVATWEARFNTRPRLIDVGVQTLVTVVAKSATLCTTLKLTVTRGAAWLCPRPLIRPYFVITILACLAI